MKKAPAVTEPADAEPETPSPSVPLRYVRRAGYAILAVELACFFAWSALLYHRFSLTVDFAIYHQGWYLIAHGNLDPVNSLQVGTGPPWQVHFWQDHSEFILWPLAVLYWIPPHDLWLLWLQDASVVVAEAVAFTWICELAQKYRTGRAAAMLAGAGLVLLVANPWIWKSVSFDFHTETLAVAFMALLVWDLASGRRRAWVWVLPLLACGDVAATYLTALGIGAILASRRTRLPGLALAVIGVAVLEVIKLVNGDQSSPLAAYMYLGGYPASAPVSIGALAKGMAHNPRLVILQLWHEKAFAWRNLAPSGLLGVGFLWILPVIVVVLLANSLLPGSLFAAPGFQSLPLYVLVPVGTVAVLSWLARREWLLGIGVTGLIVTQALYWTVAYGPRTKEQWLQVPAATASTLSSIEARIPASDEVIASQGVVGRFSSRTDVQAFFGPGPDPVRLSGGPTWFIVVPDEGIETATPQEGTKLVQELGGPGPMHATLVAHANGVWAYRWQPRRGQHEVVLP